MTNVQNIRIAEDPNESAQKAIRNSQSAIRNSRVLVLSAHSGFIDRRIVAQINTLATTGRDVTFVTVPADVPGANLDARIRVAMASGAASQGLLRRTAKRLPKPLLAPAKWVYRRFFAAPAIDFTGYFLAQAATLTPAQPYDVIHCHDLQTLPAAVELRRQLAPNAKLIYDSHELFPHQYPPGRVREYWADLERRHIGQVDLTITINQSVAEEMQRTYGRAMPAVIYNSYDGPVSAVSVDRFWRHFGVGEDHPARGAFKIIYQGNFSKERNLRNLVQAFSHLGNEFALFMLGGGEELPHLQRIAGQSHLRNRETAQTPGSNTNRQSNVFFGPWVPQGELLGFVSCADMGVIPYLGDDLLNNRLCTPNKLFEYIEAQVPICASDLVELRRIVDARGIGGVYPMSTAREIAAAISNCAKRCQSGEFRAESLAAAQQAFSWQGQSQVLLRLYDELI